MSVIAAFCPTGVAGIDWILGGGFAYGRMSEIFGNFSSGKTVILYLALAANQRRGGHSMLFESEFAFDAEFFRSLGGDPSTLQVIESTRAADVFDGIYTICEFRANAVETAYAKYNKALKAKRKKDPEPDPPQLPPKLCIGWDSIAATGTKHLMDAGMDKVDMSRAKEMRQGCRYITGMVKRAEACVIATNHTMQKIGDDYDPMRRTKRPGGDAWPYHSSQCLEMMFQGGYIYPNVPGKSDEDRTAPIGQGVVAYVDKNKCSPPHLRCSLPFYNHSGYEHPIFGYSTTLGIDYTEALFYFLTGSRFRMPDGNHAVKTDGSWYRMHESFGHDKAFRKADWPSIVAEFPHLHQLAYTNPARNGLSPETAEVAND